MSSDLSIKNSKQEVFDISKQEIVDHSYSGKTIALMITSLALVAIGLVVTALSTLLLFPPFLVPFIVGILLLEGGLSATIGGIFLACYIPNFHADEVAEREFHFASLQTDEDKKLEYVTRAASKGYMLAVRQQMAIGEELLTVSLAVVEEKSRIALCNKGLKVFESGILHGIKRNTNYIKIHVQEMDLLRPQLRKTFKDTVFLLNTPRYKNNPEKAMKAKKLFQNTLVKYANFVSKGKLVWNKKLDS